MNKIFIFLSLFALIFIIGMQEASGTEKDALDKLGIEEFKKTVKTRANSLDNFDGHREGLFVKRYTREELKEKIEKEDGRLSSNEKLIEQLKNSGLIEENSDKSEKKNLRVVDLGNFSFHKRGYFSLVRYSADGKSLYTSFMYPAKNRDAKDYLPQIFDRNALVRWNAVTGHLEEIWLADENTACAVDISRDERIAIYHVDIYEKSKDKGIEVLKNQLYSYDLRKEGVEAEKIVSYGDKGKPHIYRNLDNVALSPDGKLIVFSGQQNHYPDYGWGYQYIVNIPDKKIIKQFKLPYGKDAPAMTKAASMVFSPDGKKLARSFPERVNGKIAYIAVEILEIPSLRVAKKLPAMGSSFEFYSILFSPDSKHFIRNSVLGENKAEVIKTDSGGLFCKIPVTGAGDNISPDGKLFITFMPEQMITYFLDTRTCLRLPNRYLSKSIWDLKTAFSPDGLHMVRAGKSRNANVLDITDFNAPNEHQVDLLRRSERAIELYKAGLKKEGVLMARETINADPKGLYESDYQKRLKEAAMPLFLSGELYRKTYKLLLTENNNRLGVNVQEDKNGLTIEEVHGNTPAQKAGLVRGDKMVGIAGEKVSSTRAFLDVYKRLRPDFPTDLDIIRDGKPVNIRIIPIKGFSAYTFNVLMKFALTALEAGHPAIAMQSAGIIKDWINEGRIYTNRNMQEELIVVEASALAEMGRDDDAFGILIRQNGFRNFGASTTIFLNPDAFSSLLKDKRKLATAMMINEALLPPSPKKAASQQSYPDLAGKIIKPLTSPPAIGVKQPEKLQKTFPHDTLDGGIVGQTPSGKTQRGTILD